MYLVDVASEGRLHVNFSQNVDEVSILSIYSLVEVLAEVFCLLVVHLAFREKVFFFISKSPVVLHDYYIFKSIFNRMHILVGEVLQVDYNGVE